VILDHPRRRSVERAWQTLDLARRYRDRGVVAIGVAGQEAHSISRFAEVFSTAERHGVRRVHHAGEECGPASIREAVTTGRADRIGHGITAVEDGDLLAELRNRGVPLEVCPSSNVALGLVRTLGEPPSSACGTPA
jgi:adenosine deaminase